ncbi:MAG TPA: hypothetical protein VK728_04845 [Candidatus Sulfotelmatobacter sp.]|jgi:hypothetical protein|nr:hypothetical protein [Candidatus Sulfotelmatobacter sp.]
MNPVEKRTIKLGLIANAVFFVLIFFVQRLASLAWNLVLKLGGHLHQGYVDSIYRSAGAGEQNLVGHMTLLFLLSAPLYLIFYFQLTSRNETAAAPDRPNARRYLEKFERGILLIGAISGIPAYFSMFLIFSISFGIFQINASFDRRLTVLAPAITDVEYKTLKARWANMQSKADYDALVSDMDNRAAMLNVKLPPVRKP